MEQFLTDPLKQLRNRIRHSVPVNIVLGAGDVWYGHNWIATNVEELNVTDRDNWKFYFETCPIDNILCEHVWEHLTTAEAIMANNNAFEFLKPGGNFRIAVPDGLHPDKKYIDYVKPGGSGAGALDHKVLFNFVSMSRQLLMAGFDITLLEYWDGDGHFNFNPWRTDKGMIQRSLRFDERNDNKQPIYTSLIIDAVRPLVRKEIGDWETMK